MKILVPFDGSTHATNAVSEAINLANAYSGSITVLLVHWDPAATGTYDGTEIRDQPSSQRLKQIEGVLKNSNIQYELRSESNPNPPDTIVSIANQEKYDAIIMGSRGIGGARAWLLGSVSSKVAAEALCPVIIVK